MIKQHGVVGHETRVVDQFEAHDIGAPFKVILHDCVQVTTNVETGEMIDYTIPDLDGLLRTIALTRVLNKRKMLGAEVKFIRKVAGVKQKCLAKSIEMSAEHLSRCEAGASPINPASEKLLRIYLFKMVLELHKVDPCDESTKLESALDRLFGEMKSIPVHDVNDPLILRFHRARVPCEPSKGAANDEVREKWGDGEKAAA